MDNVLALGNVNFFNHLQNLNSLVSTMRYNTNKLEILFLVSDHTSNIKIE